jgi:hypothetical protein
MGKYDRPTKIKSAISNTGAQISKIVQAINRVS